MSVVQLDSFRARRQVAQDLHASQSLPDPADAAAPTDIDPQRCHATEAEADLALKLADANARIDDLEAVLVETLKRNAMNWARAQEAEAKLSALTGTDPSLECRKTP